MMYIDVRSSGGRSNVVLDVVRQLNDTFHKDRKHQK